MTAKLALPRLSLASQHSLPHGVVHGRHQRHHVVGSVHYHVLGEWPARPKPLVPPVHVLHLWAKQHTSPSQLNTPVPANFLPFTEQIVFGQEPQNRLNLFSTMMHFLINSGYYLNLEVKMCSSTEGVKDEGGMLDPNQ
ncbi:hypothetical protein E2C01_032798 [Portunus trituberculatus]|uniref:Uncharacterized protein n=1 Tax=Portunus trituberculatus TaxID=210409 RepID=A0A5B7F211_PORTR|nr:hypothetical protein [Portunus trituberculatus]